MTQRLADEVAKLRQDIEVIGIRLTLAQAWVGFLNFAHDTLVAHGINFKTLNEYKDSTVLDEAAKMPLTKARDKITTWIEKLHSGLHAAVRRKGFKVHDNGETLH